MERKPTEITNIGASCPSCGYETDSSPPAVRPVTEAPAVPIPAAVQSEIDREADRLASSVSERYSGRVREMAVAEQVRRQRRIQLLAQTARPPDAEDDEGPAEDVDDTSA
jgi:hypothetical protein